MTMIEKYKQAAWRLILVAAMSFLLSMMLFRPVSAADYNCGAYGAGAYNEGQVCATTTDSGGSSEGSDEGGLLNTGQAVAIAVPALAILVGTITLYRLSSKRKRQEN